MTFSFVQSVYSPAAQTTATSVTFTNPVSPGNIVVGAVGYFPGAVSSLTSVTDEKGNTYNLSPTISFASVASDRQFNLFYLPTTPFRPRTINTNFQVSSGFTAAGIYAAEFTPGGFVDQVLGLGGIFQSIPISGILTTPTLPVPQANSLLIGLEASIFSLGDPAVNPQSGGNWSTIIRDVSAESTDGPTVIFQYQVIPSASSAYGVSTGWNSSNNIFNATLIMDFCPAPLAIIQGQACVG
jgi:hypothetical protein